MRGKRFVRTTGAGFVIIILVAAWLAFVPFATWPGYEFVKAWGRPGEQAGEFNDPTGIGVTANAVFVADSRNGRIQAFGHEGRYQHQFQLSRRRRRGSRRYRVRSGYNDRVQAFAADSAFLRKWGGPFAMNILWPIEMMVHYCIRHRRGAGRDRIRRRLPQQLCRNVATQAVSDTLSGVHAVYHRYSPKAVAP